MSSSHIVFLGFTLTVLFAVFCLWLGVQDHCVSEGELEGCQSNFKKFLESPPNEKGDTLAGVAGSLAFLWIIITVLLQSKELAMQRDEIEKMRITQENQTALLVEQAERVGQKSVDATAIALVDYIKSSVRKLGFAGWVLEDDEGNSRSVNFISPSFRIPNDDTACEWWKNRIENAEESVMRFLSVDGKSVAGPEMPLVWKELRDTAGQVVEILAETSPEVQTWLQKTIQIQDFHDVLVSATNNDRLWARD